MNQTTDGRVIAYSERDREFTFTKKKKDKRKKPQGKNIMVCPITEGDHKKKE